MAETCDLFLQTLLRTQFLPQDRMRDYQRGLVERLVRHAREHVRYYRERGTFDRLFDENDVLLWDRWDEVPVLTRIEAQHHQDALYADHVPPECGEVLSGYTAGSTGRPLAFKVNGMLRDVGTAMLERGLVWAGVPPDITLAWFRNDKQGGAAYPEGATYKSIVRGTERLSHHLSVQTPVQDQARWLARVQADVVMGYPNALALLADERPIAQAQRPYRLAICLGEVTSDDARAAIERGFGCPVMDLYSGSEFGPVAVEDIGARSLLLCEETILVETRPMADVVDAREPPVELLLTSFYNYAMPLIRYATGDYAVLDDNDGVDGRTLRRFKRVLGRDRDYFLMPSGRRWWPTYQNKVLCDFLDYKQIQFAQTARDRIEIRFASDAPTPVSDVAGLQRYLRDATPEAVAIEIRQVASIPSRASGKYDYATCEIGKTPATAERST